MSACAASPAGPSTCARASPPTTEVVHGDVLQPETMAPALAGVDTVYYLVHSMSSSRPFDEADREAALAFGGPRGRQECGR